MELSSAENHKHLAYVQVNRNGTQDRTLMHHTLLPPQKQNIYPSTLLKKGCVELGEYYGELRQGWILKACRNVNRLQSYRGTAIRRNGTGEFCAASSLFHTGFFELDRGLLSSPIWLNSISLSHFHYQQEITIIQYPAGWNYFPDIPPHKLHSYSPAPQL